MYPVGTVVAVVPKPPAVMAYVFRGHHLGLAQHGRFCASLSHQGPFFTNSRNCRARVGLGRPPDSGLQTVREATPLAQAPPKEQVPCV